MLILLQEVYYTTHQFFLSADSINIVVFDSTKSVEENEILFWLKSIQVQAPGSTLVLVGTFLDKLKKGLTEKDQLDKLVSVSKEIQDLIDDWNSSIEEEDEKKKRLRVEMCHWSDSHTLSFWPVSCIDKEGIDSLSEQLTAITFRYIFSFFLLCFFVSFHYW